MRRPRRARRSLKGRRPWSKDLWVKVCHCDSVSTARSDPVKGHTLTSSSSRSRPRAFLPPEFPMKASNASSTGSGLSLTCQVGWLGCGRRRTGMRIAGGVCFHRGSSGFTATGCCARGTEVVNERTADELEGVLWRRARAQEAQTKGVRGVDIVAIRAL